MSEQSSQILPVRFFVVFILASVCACNHDHSYMQIPLSLFPCYFANLSSYCHFKHFLFILLFWCPSHRMIQVD